MKKTVRYIGGYRRPLGIGLDWPNDGDTARALVTVQRIDRRRDDKGKEVCNPLGKGLVITPSDLPTVISVLQRYAELLKIGKL